MQEKITHIVTLLMLGRLAYQDVCEKRISVAVLSVSGILAILFQWMACKRGFPYVVKSMIPGMLMLALSFVTKEKIGYGDGWTVLVIGLWCGGLFTFVTCQIAFFLSGIYALIIFLCGKRGTIAFVPFLLIGMEVCLWLG